MRVIFYTFTKRKNSLDTPSGEGFTSECVLKDTCTILRPRIELASAYNLQWNYCYIPDFQRYYYVSDSEYFRGVWTLECRFDAMASWEGFIRNTSAQVIFSSSHYNVNLLDNRIPATGNLDRQVSTEAFTGALGNATESPSGYFALTVLSGNGIWATGVSTTYFMTYRQMQVFAQELLAPEGLEAIKQYFDNPMDSLIDCYYIPLDITNYVALSTTTHIVIGGYTFPSAIGRTPQSTSLANKSMSATIEIPWVYDDFRRLSPYTNIDLFVPFCGSKPIPPEDCYQHDAILLSYSVDVTTGDVQCIAYLKETVLQEWAGNCRIMLPVGQTQSRVGQTLGALSSGIAAVGKIGAGNVAAGATGVLNAIGSVLSPTEVKQCGGFSGSILGACLGNDQNLLWQKFRMSVTSHLTEASPSSIRATIGNVNGDVEMIGNLSGYCQTLGASVSAPAFAEELDEINAMLDGGVYL